MTPTLEARAREWLTQMDAVKMNVHWVHGQGRVAHREHQASAVNLLAALLTAIEREGYARGVQEAYGAVLGSVDRSTMNPLATIRALLTKEPV